MALKPKRPRDMNQLAKLIVDIAVGDAPPDTAPTKKQVAGRAGGLKGGKTRMAVLSEAQRIELARTGAAKRWKKAAPVKARPKPT